MGYLISLHAGGPQAKRVLLAGWISRANGGEKCGNADRQINYSNLHFFRIK